MTIPKTVPRKRTGIKASCRLHNAYKISSLIEPLRGPVILNLNNIELMKMNNHQSKSWQTQFDAEVERLSRWFEQMNSPLTQCKL